MNFRFSIVASIALALSLVGMIVAGCATPVEVGPTVQPGGIQTPRITPVFPPAPGLPNLPKGFVPCGDYVAPITLEDGTTVNIRVCIYCSATDNRVYVQQDCMGYYREGQRNGTPGQRVPAPRSVPLANLGGDLSPDGSVVSFTLREDFKFDPKMIEGATAELAFGGMEGLNLHKMGPMAIPAGTEVTISGDNAGVADILFWSFGVGSLTARTDFGNEVRLEVGFSDLLGAYVVMAVDGEVLKDAGGMLPWRR